MTIPFEKIEKKWQKRWDEARCFEASSNQTQKKYFALDMFPYPSGAGLHLGHIASYTPTDIIARYKRTQGFNVLHPMGYDAFGLPAEQYAIQTGTPPEQTIQKSVESFKKLLQEMGYSFDWSREISTCDPQFYKWTQWIFLKLWENGLAYQKEMPVNWCPELKTVLANEEVIDGKSERGGHPVVQKMMKQWVLKITKYAERLLEDLEELDWPEKTKEMQKHWIGKSYGTEIHFKVKEHQKHTLNVFTTRPDTLFGATFMVIAPEHSLTLTLTTEKQKQDVEKYISYTLKRSERDRKADTRKTGVFTGSYAIHPTTQEDIPIWTADYVLSDYGTGAIMAVPAHDERDYVFAREYDLPIKQVLKDCNVHTEKTLQITKERTQNIKAEKQNENHTSINQKTTLPFTGEGKLIQSDFLNGLTKTQAIESINQYLMKKNIATVKVQYKLRDWLFSRQRYWGEPFPMVHLSDGTIYALGEDELPVTLPSMKDYKPSETGEPPLAKSQEFINYSKNNVQGMRDTNTMPGSAGSSWYFLRYTDPKNETAPFGFENQKYWMPVDLYVGGSEHTVGHLLYSRFWQKVLYDLKLTSYKEPFKKLLHQGVVIGPDNQRMSKSRGNIINPLEVKKKFGADALRAYISFVGPFEKNKRWDENGIEGIKKFLERVWRLCVDEKGYKKTKELKPEDISTSLLKLYHQSLKKVQYDIEHFKHNTALSQMMTLCNHMTQENSHPHFIIAGLIQMLAPFCPHISEELWERIGEKPFASIAPFPQYDETLAMAEDTVTIGVQVNGKMRGTIQVSKTTSEEEAIEKAHQIKAVKQAIKNKTIKKVIYRSKKILNLIAP